MSRCATCEELLESQDPVHCDACLNEGMDEQCERLIAERDEARRAAEEARALLKELRLFVSMLQHTPQVRAMLADVNAHLDRWSRKPGRQP